MDCIATIKRSKYVYHGIIPSVRGYGSFSRVIQPAYWEYQRECTPYTAAEVQAVEGSLGMAM